MDESQILNNILQLFNKYKYVNNTKELYRILGSIETNLSFVGEIEFKKSGMFNIKKIPKYFNIPIFNRRFIIYSRYENYEEFLMRMVKNYFNKNNISINENIKNR